MNSLDNYIKILFIGGPFSKEFICIPNNIDNYVTNEFDYKEGSRHYYTYHREKIRGQKENFYIMRYVNISVDEMLRILINGE